MQTMGFFNTVYNIGFKDSSAFGWAERAANVCRTPRRWLAADLGLNSTMYGIESLSILISDTPKIQGMKKVVRIIIGIVFSIPGEMLATCLMSAAFLSREIRLKHTFTERSLSPQEYQELGKLIAERQKLAKERQGCDPFSCSLVTIICLLCCLVCKA